MLSKAFEQRHLLVLALIAFVTLLALLEYQLTLQSALASWVRPSESPAPSLPSPEDDFSAAIVYLAEKRRLDDTMHSLGSLLRYIPWRSPWPIILFHTGDFDDQDVLAEFNTKLEEGEWTKEVHSQLRERIEFVRIEFTLPPGVSPDVDVYKPEEWAFRWPGKPAHAQSIQLSFLNRRYPAPIQDITTCVDFTQNKSFITPEYAISHTTCVWTPTPIS